MTWMINQVWIGEMEQLDEAGVGTGVWSVTIIHTVYSVS